MNKMKKALAHATTGLIALAPAIALAQFGQIDDEVGRVVTFINNVLIPLIFTIALLVFIWGMFKFFISNGAEGAEEGKKLAIYAIVGFVLMVSIWGIVNVISGGLGFSGEQIQGIPTVPTR